MTLEEYAKVLEEKRKALQTHKTEERKVTLDKDLESMKQLSSKKENLDVFIKLVCMVLSLQLWACWWFVMCQHYLFQLRPVQGSDKDKRKEGVDKEERAKKVNWYTDIFLRHVMACVSESGTSRFVERN